MAETRKPKKKIEEVPQSADARGRMRMREGVVVSAKMAKTIVVSTTRLFPHPLYGKVVKVNKKVYAHDEKGQAKVGDTVRIIETRPLSKTKRYQLVEVVKQ